VQAMESCDKITEAKIADEIRLRFAKMALEMIESLRKCQIREIDPEIIQQIRENAQTIGII
jgi:hypothetical protein